MLITVSGKDIKQAFSAIAPLIKKSETSNSVAIGYEDNILYITIDAGIRYQKEIAVKSVIDPVTTTLTVWFKDISDFIYARSDVNIEINNLSVSISTDDFSTNLLVSDAIITRLTSRGGERRDINLDLLEMSVKKLLSTSAVSRALQVTKPIVFDMDYAYMKFTTIWIKCKSSGLKSILSVEYAKNIIDFQPEYVYVSDVLEFHREDAMLVVPNNVSSDERAFDNIVETTKHITTIPTEQIFGILQKLSRALGNATAKVYVYEGGLEFAVSTPTSKVSKKINATGEVKTSFEAPLEFLLVCFNLIGDLGIDIRRKDGLICLRNNILTILLSVA